MTTSGKGVGAMGNNPWDKWSEEDQAFSIMLRESDEVDYTPGKNSKFIFDDSMPKDLKGLMTIYEFYCGCIDAARHKAFDDTCAKNCFDVDFNASERDAVIYTVAYFGYEEVKKRLIKYRKEIPRHVAELFNPILLLKIKKNTDFRKISYVYSDDSPFPKFEVIN